MNKQNGSGSATAYSSNTPPNRKSSRPAPDKVGLCAGRSFPMVVQYHPIAQRENLRLRRPKESVRKSVGFLRKAFRLLQCYKRLLFWYSMDGLENFVPALGWLAANPRSPENARLPSSPDPAPLCNLVNFAILESWLLSHHPCCFESELRQPIHANHRSPHAIPFVKKFGLRLNRISGKFQSALFLYLHPAGHAYLQAYPSRQLRSSWRGVWIMRHQAAGYRNGIVITRFNALDEHLLLYPFF